MYEPDTILALKEPRGTEDEPFPYDRVRVIGQSPCAQAGIASEWVGTADGQGVIIEPLAGFAANLDEPYGKLRELYDIEAMPVREADVEPKVRIVTPGTAGPSPEEVFKASQDKETDRRLPEERGDYEVVQQGSSPLDGPPSPEETAAREAEAEKIREDFAKQKAEARKPRG